MELTPEERKIIRSYRGLSDSRKQAVLASENSFLSWVQTALKWLWETLVPEVFRGLFRILLNF